MNNMFTFPSPRKVAIYISLILLHHHRYHHYQTSAFILTTPLIKNVATKELCISPRTVPSIQTTALQPSHNTWKRNQMDGLQVKAVSTGSIGAVALPLSQAVATSNAARGIGSYFLTRIVFLRGLAFVYFVAFLIALHQNKGLIGDSGITPGTLTINA